MRRALLLALLVVACQGPPAPVATPPPTPEGARGGTLVISDYEWPATLDPQHATTEAELRLAGLLYEPLWTFDPDLRPVPRLLAAMPVPKPGPGSTMSLDLKLRPGLRWSDGSPLTSDDLIQAAAALARSPISSQERVSATEVTWRFTELDPGWLTLGPRVVPARPDLASGPFKVAGQVPGSEIQLVRNPEYASGRGRAPWLDGITFRAYGGKAAEIAALQNGQTDLGFHLLPSDLPQLESLGGQEGVVTATLRGEMLVPNLAAAPWAADPSLLPAVGAAIDRVALNQAAFDGKAEPAAGLFPAPLSGFDSGLPAAPKPAKLKQGFTLLTICDDQVRQQEQAELVRQWAQLGARVDSACEPRASFFDVLAQGRFQLALFSDDFAPDPSAWAQLPDFGHCRDGAIDQELATGASTLDAPARRAAYKEAAGKWLKAGCTIPLYYWPSVVMRSSRLHGFEPNPVAGLDTWNAADWWLTPS